MILTGRNLTAYARAILGEDWVTKLAKRVGCSKRTIIRRRNNDTVPPEWRQALIDAIDETFAALGERRSALVQVYDDAA